MITKKDLLRLAGHNEERIGQLENRIKQLENMVEQLNNRVGQLEYELGYDSKISPIFYSMTPGQIRHSKVISQILEKIGLMYSDEFQLIDDGSKS